MGLSLARTLPRKIRLVKFIWYSFFPSKSEDFVANDLSANQHHSERICGTARKRLQNHRGIFSKSRKRKQNTIQLQTREEQGHSLARLQRTRPACLSHRAVFSERLCGRTTPSPPRLPAPEAPPSPPPCRHCYPGSP